MDLTQKYEAQSGEDASHKEQPPGPEAVGGETDYWGCNPSFDTSDGGGKGGGRITPAEFFHNGVEEGRKRIVKGPCAPQMDHAGCQNDPPSVKNPVQHQSYLYTLITLFSEEGSHHNY